MDQKHEEGEEGESEAKEERREEKIKAISELCFTALIRDYECFARI